MAETRRRHGIERKLYVLNREWFDMGQTRFTEDGYEEQRRSPEELEQSAFEVLDEAVEEHAPVAMYGMISGGNDSLATCLVASQHPAFTRAVHINTEIGIPKTREFVRETCAAQEWNLWELTPPDKSYEEFVCEYGFPGPAAHIYAFSWLKERAMNQLVRETKEHYQDRVGLITGVRSQESTRRMGHVERINRDGAKVWVAPIHDWNAVEVRQYIAHHGVETNPVSDLLHMSGECLCGAYARPGEFEEIEMWYPEVADRIRSIEDMAEECGAPRVRWGNRAEPRYEEPLDSFAESPLCTGCAHRHEQGRD